MELIVQMVGLCLIMAWTTLQVVRVVDFFKFYPTPPNLGNTWWGPGLPSEKEDKAIRPFKINISDEVIEDLKWRLYHARPFTPSLEGVKQHYGVNAELLKKIVSFWKAQYNWEERQGFLNGIPQFTTNIQGLQIHFIHVKPAKTAGVRVLPLLLLHGWASSVREFYEIIPMLTSLRNRDFVFEVIAPSLPGFAFSQGTTKPGLGVAEMAVIFKNLMRRLGFATYYVQGGDWGGQIASAMAVMYPTKIRGMHSNLCLVNTPLSNLKLILGYFDRRSIVEIEFEDRLYPLSDFLSNLILETGYFHIQATKPDSLGVALNDSPVGLAAYIIDKFIAWTNPMWKDRAEGGLTDRFSYTDLLDNVMLYWVTASITTSMRIYAETMSTAHRKMRLERIPVEVPSACARFRHELIYQPDHILKEKYRQLVQSSDYNAGGHFAAFELPQVLADDVWNAVAKFEEIHRRAKRH